MDQPPQERATAVILSVGTELTEGSILNTHFRFLGAELKGLGYFTKKAVQIPDDPDVFLEELRLAVDSAALAIITGGLGPTSDDLTREVVAKVCAAPLRFDDSIWDSLVARYSVRGRKIAATNRKQAYLPAGFRILPNRVGTAPGFLGTAGNCTVMALPGPPAELERMFLDEAVPLILSNRGGAGGLSEAELRATALMIPESVLEQALLEHRGKDSGMLWSTRVAADRIVFTLRGAEQGERMRVFTALVQEFGSIRIREGDVQPSFLLFDTLKRRGERLAVAESCTGGLVSKMITDLPGSSAVFWGTLVTYSNESKMELLGVSRQVLERSGAVSPEAASAMSAGLLERTPVEAAVAVTGIAGPEGGTPEKPVGTVWISARTRCGGHLCRGFHFPGNRDSIRRRSAVAALLLSECVVLEVEAELEY
jgi:nicotinamide-nucleotide amidase